MFSTVFVSCGNPDFRQHPDMELPGVPSMKVKEHTLAAVRDKWLQWISDNDLGGGNTIPTIIFNSMKKPVARISYNGRLWHPETGEEIIV